MIALIVIGSILLILIILLNIPVRVRAAYYDRKLSYDVKYAAFTLLDSEKEDSGTDEEKPEKPKKPKKPKKDDKDGRADESPQDTEEASDTSDEKPPDSGEKEEILEKPEDADDKKDDDKDKPAEDKKPGKKKKPVSLIPKQHLADRIIEAAEGITDKIDAVKLLIDLVWDDLIKLIKKIYFTGLVVDLVSANEDAAEAAIGYGRMNAVTYDTIAVVKALTRLDVKSVRIDCLYDTPKERSRYDGEITMRLRPASLVNAAFAVLFRFLLHIKKYKPILDTFLKK